MTLPSPERNHTSCSPTDRRETIPLRVPVPHRREQSRRLATAHSQASHAPRPNPVPIPRHAPLLQLSLRAMPDCRHRQVRVPPRPGESITSRTGAAHAPKRNWDRVPTPPQSRRVHALFPPATARYGISCRANKHRTPSGWSWCQATDPAHHHPPVSPAKRRQPKRQFLPAPSERRPECDRNGWTRFESPEAASIS